MCVPLVAAVDAHAVIIQRLHTTYKTTYPIRTMITDYYSILMVYHYSRTNLRSRIRGSMHTHRPRTAVSIIITSITTIIVMTIIFKIAITLWLL